MRLEGSGWLSAPRRRQGGEVATGLQPGELRFLVQPPGPGPFVECFAGARDRIIVAGRGAPPPARDRCWRVQLTRATGCAASQRSSESASAVSPRSAASPASSPRKSTLVESSATSRRAISSASAYSPSISSDHAATSRSSGVERSSDGPTPIPGHGARRGLTCGDGIAVYRELARDPAGDPGRRHGVLRPSVGVGREADDRSSSRPEAPARCRAAPAPRWDERGRPARDPRSQTRFNGAPGGMRSVAASSSRWRPSR